MDLPTLNYLIKKKIPHRYYPIRPLCMGGCAGGAGVPAVTGEVLLFLNNVRNAMLGNIKSLAESGVLSPPSVISLLSVALHSRK